MSSLGAPGTAGGSERAHRVTRMVPHFLLERLDGDILLYHPGLTKTIRLNETASAIWELCDGRHSVREIVELLGEAFPEAHPDVLADVEATVRRFADEGAVTFAAAQS